MLCSQRITTWRRHPALSLLFMWVEAGNGSSAPLDPALPPVSAVLEGIIVGLFLELGTWPFVPSFYLCALDWWVTR